MRPYKFNETDITEIEGLLRQGRHIKTIAKDRGVDFTLIYKLKNNLEIKDPTFKYSDVRVRAKDKARGRTIKLSFPNCTEEKINRILKLLTDNEIKYKIWQRDKDIIEEITMNE